MTDNLPVAQEQWDDILPVVASQRAVQRYNAVVDFAVNQLKFGMHYDVLPAEQWKCRGKSTEVILKDPSIKKFFGQAGADMLNMAWGIRSEAVVIHSVERPDDAEPYFAYQIQSNLIHIGTGKVVGSAVGSCSSREVKYRYRWFSKADIDNDPRLAGLDLTLCKKRAYGKGDYAKEQFQVINPDLGDIQPTIFMMAEKRAYVKATRRLHGISELFNQPLDAIEHSTMEEIEEQEKKPKPERASLSDKDIKPGNPTTHQDVRKPHSSSEPPPPDDNDAPLFDRKGSPVKEPKGKKAEGDTLRGRFEAYVEKHQLRKRHNGKGLQYLYDLMATQYDQVDIAQIAATPDQFQAWLDEVATKELTAENYIDIERK